MVEKVLIPLNRPRCLAIKSFDKGNARSRTEKFKSAIDTRIGEEQYDILVIDDSKISLDYMLDILHEHGLSAMGLPSPIGSIRAAFKRDIRVVVTDVNMPDISGNRLVGLFHNNRRLKHIKIILVSSLPQHKLYQLGTESSANGVIQKANLEAELVPTARRLLE